MKAQLEKIIGMLEPLLEKAADYADSENERTAEKYADVPDFIQDAISSLNDAVDALEN